MAERKRIQTGAKRDAGQPVNTVDRRPVRSGRSIVVGSIISAAAVAVGITIWQLNRVPQTPQKTPTTASQPAEAGVNESPVPPREAAEALESEVLEAIGKLIEAMPLSSDPLALMATVQLRFGNTPQAVRWWERSLEVNPRRPDVYDGLAQVAEAKGQHAKAAELWGKVLQINPRLPGIRNKLAGVLIDSGKMDQAIAALKEELKIPSRERPLAYFLLGKAYLQMREFDKARKSYEAAVAIQPDYASAWYGLATTHARLGHSEQAEQYMKKFRKFMEDSGLSADESRTGRVAGRDATGSKEHSQRDLAATRRLAALTHASIAAVYRTKGYLHWAKRHWLRAAELDPKDATCRTQLASLYLKSGKYEKALPICEQLVKIDPTNVAFHVNLGILYAKMNQLDAALATLQRAIELDPKAPRPRQVYQEIQKRKQRER